MSRSSHGRFAAFLAVALFSAGLTVQAAPERVFLEKNLVLAPGGSFELDADAGVVEVTGGSGSEARIVIRAAREDLDKYLDIDFEETDGKVRVTAKKAPGSTGWFKTWRPGKVHWEISVPAQTEVDIDTSGGSIHVTGIDGRAVLDASGGGIHVQSLGGDLVADSSGGSIEARGIKANAELDSSGGGITVSDVDGWLRIDSSGGGSRIENVRGDIEADTSGGGVHIKEAGGRVEADSSGGPVSVVFAAGNATGGRLSSSGGGVKVWIDAGAALDVDASASGGSVNCDIPVTVQGKIKKSSLRGQINGGGSELVLRSSGGGIHIEAR
jgi:DUF4097 and DUF4098 domain-containing protein YvlB